MGSGAGEAIEIEGRRLAWRTVGQGPPLLLINGYAATGEDWDPTFLAELGEAFELICPDNRGVGESELGAAAVSVDGMAADLEPLLDSLAIDRLPVVGWSMGGFVAQGLALRSPGRVSALALLSTDPGGPSSIPAAPEAWSRLVDRSGTPREQASRLISLLFPPALAAEIEREFGEVAAAARAALSPEVLRAQEAAMEAWHRGEPSDPGADELRPTLVLHGELDEVIPAANASALASRWTNATVGASRAVATPSWPRSRVESPPRSASWRTIADEGWRV